MRMGALVFVSLLPLLCASPSLAQMKLADEITLGLSNVLKYDGVSQELELTIDQTEKLAGLWVEVEMKLELAFEEYKNDYSPRFDNEQRQQLLRGLESDIEAVRADELERLTDALLPHQLQRLKQIRVQILKRNGGLRGLAQELSLTDDQLDRIEAIQRELKTTLVELQKQARVEQLTGNEIREESSAIRQKHRTRLLEVLTQAQRLTLKRIEGAPFELQSGRRVTNDENK